MTADREFNSVEELREHFERDRRAYQKRVITRVAIAAPLAIGTSILLGNVLPFGVFLAIVVLLHCFMLWAILPKHWQACVYCGRRTVGNLPMSAGKQYPQYTLLLRSNPNVTWICAHHIRQYMNTHFSAEDF